jgi:hypothetical protein
MIVSAILPILVKIGAEKDSKMQPVYLFLRRLMTALALFGLLAFSTASARDADIPNLNVDPLCHGITEQGADPLEAGDPNVSFKQCLESERADRATLEKEWATFSAANKKNCTDEAETGGLSSYTELLTCLEMARDVDKERDAEKDKSQQPAQQSSSGRKQNTR